MEPKAPVPRSFQFSKVKSGIRTGMITSCPTSHLDFIFPVPNIGDDCMNLSRIPFLTHPANLLKYQFSFHPSTNPLSAIYNLLLFLVNHFRLLLFTGISKNSRKWKSINYQHLSCLYRMKTGGIQKTGSTDANPGHTSCCHHPS